MAVHDSNLQTPNNMIILSTSDEMGLRPKKSKAYVGDQEYRAYHALLSDEELLGQINEKQGIPRRFTCLGLFLVLLIGTYLLSGAIIFFKTLGMIDTLVTCTNKVILSCQRFSEVLDIQTCILTNWLVYRYLWM